MIELKYLSLFLIPIMAVLAHMAGGSLGGKRLPSQLPELCMGIIFGVMFHAKYSGMFWPGAAAGWAYGWMETGYGTAIHMGKNPEESQNGRREKLDKLVIPLCNAIGAPLGGPVYCWLFMGLKGALIGLAAYPWGLLMAFLYPAAYFVGNNLFWDPVARKGRADIAELGSGAAAGLVLAINYLF